MALIQHKAATIVIAGTTIPVTYGSAVTAGSALMCFVYWNNSAQTATVADSVNGAWTAITTGGGPLTGAGALATWRVQGFYKLTTAAGTPVVTATFSGSNTDKGIAVHEVGGNLTAFDSSAYGNTASVANAFTTTSVTVADGGEYIMLGVLCGGGVVTITAPGTLRANSEFLNNATADQIAPTKGARTFSGTTSGPTNDNACMLAAFRGTRPGRRRVVGTAVHQAVR